MRGGMAGRRLRRVGSGQRCGGLRALVLVAFLAAVLGCSGTAKRARIASDLSLDIAPGGAVLQAGGTVSLTVELRNHGPRPIDICLKNDAGVAVTDVNGKRWPLKSTSVVFDAECSERLRLLAGDARSFSDQLVVWPRMPEGPGVLEVWLRFSVSLNQFYRPGAEQTLVATLPVSILGRALPAP